MQLSDNLHSKHFRRYIHWHKEFLVQHSLLIQRYLFLQLNFSEHSYFENILENLRAGAQKSLRKLRERVDQDM